MDKLSIQHINSDWIQQYESALEVLWHQAVRMNANMYLLKKIAEFPFDLFAPPNSICWTLITDALYSNIVMISWRIVADTGKDVLTLPKLKNEMLKNAKSEHSRAFLMNRLKEANFAKRIRSTRALIERVRNEWLAHLQKDVVLAAHQSKRGMPIISANRLISLGEATNDLITALSLDSGRASIYLEYSDDVTKPAGMDPRPDIEKLLDLVARDSDLLKMPEEQREFWPTYRQGLPEETLATLNLYRKKLGLSEA